MTWSHVTQYKHWYSISDIYITRSINRIVCSSIFYRILIHKCRHSHAVGSVAALQHQGLQFNPGLRLLSVKRFTCSLLIYIRVLQFPPAPRIKWMCKCMLVLLPAVDQHSINGLFQPHSQCSWDRLWIHCEHCQDKATESGISCHNFY